jgi:colanic acid biosynthesis glycosyl transferase WcaI
MKMNVLVLAQYFPPDMGGGATRAFNVAKGLAINGCNVTIIAAFPHYPMGNVPEKYRWKPLSVEYMHGLKVFRTFIPPLASEGILKRAFLFISFAVSSLFALLFIGHVDVVWAANPNVICVFPSFVYSFLKGCPLVQNVDDLWPESLYILDISRKSRFGEFLAEITYKLSSAITPISPGYVKILCEKYGVSREKVHIVRAGVDLSTFRAKDNLFGSKEEAFTVLYSGAFSLAYDFDQVLLAAKALDNVDEVKFVLQGGGELAGHLKVRVRELKLKNVRIMDRIVSRDEVAKLLSGADALILPLRDFGSPYLGLSSKLYEYQAAGMPIICCAEGQPAEYVKETNSGIVIRPGDYESLAKAVVFLRENRGIAKKLGVLGRQHVENDLTLDKIGLRMMTVFKKI